MYQFYVIGCFLSLSLFACGPLDLLFGSDQTPLEQSNDKKLKEAKKNKIRKKCGTLNVVYKAFQDYIICIEKTPVEVYNGTYAEFIIRKDGSKIQVACADGFNQVYESIPDAEKRNTGIILFYDMDYFHDLYEVFSEPPATLGITGLFYFSKSDSKAQSCFEEKLEEYRKEDSSFLKQFTNNQADHKVFLKDCRKQEGEKAYQKLNQQFGCDTI